MLNAIKSAAVAVLAIGSLTAQGWAQEKTVKIDGSSTVYPITEAAAEEFKGETKGDVRVTVGISGTGGGFKKFVRGETDISNASRPILQKEIDEAKANGIEFIELPVAFDALTVVINNNNDWVKELTVADLKKMWGPDSEGKVMKWSDIRPEWPANDLKLYGPGPDSGTFDYFTEAVNGKSKASRKDYTPSEDDNVLVQGVSNDKAALGYFGLAYFSENKDKLKAVPVVNKAGKAIVPSAEATKDGSYNPLARPIFIYVNKKSLDTKPEVKAFVEFYLTNADALVSEVKYVPLPEDAYKKALERVKAGKTGSVFGGKEQIGMTIEQLFEAELKN